MAIGKLRCMRCGGDHKTDDCDKSESALSAVLDGRGTIAKTFTIRMPNTFKASKVSIPYPGPPPHWTDPGYVWPDDLLKAAKAELMRRYRARKAAKK